MVVGECAAGVTPPILIGPFRPGGLHGYVFGYNFKLLYLVRAGDPSSLY